MQTFVGKPANGLQNKRDPIPDETSMQNVRSDQEPLTVKISYCLSSKAEDTEDGPQSRQMVELNDLIPSSHPYKR